MDLRSHPARSPSSQPEDRAKLMEVTERHLRKWKRICRRTVQVGATAQEFHHRLGAPHKYHAHYVHPQESDEPAQANNLCTVRGLDALVST